MGKVGVRVFCFIVLVVGWRGGCGSQVGLQGLSTLPSGESLHVHVCVDDFLLRNGQQMAI